MKSVKIAGKNRIPSLPVASRISRPRIRTDLDERLQPPRHHGMLARPGHDQQVGAAATAIAIHSEELVNERS